MKISATMFTLWLVIMLTAYVWLGISGVVITAIAGLLLMNVTNS